MTSTEASDDFATIEVGQIWARRADGVRVRVEEIKRLPAFESVVWRRIDGRSCGDVLSHVFRTRYDLEGKD